MLDPTINTAGYEHSATINNEADVIYIARDIAGGMGGIDIYMQKKLPSGEWGEAINLGKNINTLLDEDYPSLSADGKTLYFCSQGHNSMGGYDIFKSTWNEEKQEWNPAKNLGYPINSPDNETSISFARNGKFAYFATHRDNCIGDLDIYSITFVDVEPLLSTIHGRVLASDSTVFYGKDQEIRKKEMKIVVTDTKTNKIIGKYRPDKRTSKYVMILSAGESYKISIEIEDYDTYEEIFEVQGKGNFRGDILKDIMLYKKGTTPASKIQPTAKPKTTPQPKKHTKK